MSPYKIKNFAWRCDMSEVASSLASVCSNNWENFSMPSSSKDVVLLDHDFFIYIKKFVVTLTLRVTELIYFYVFLTLLILSQ